MHGPAVVEATSRGQLAQPTVSITAGVGRVFDLQPEGGFPDAVPLRPRKQRVGRVREVALDREEAAKGRRRGQLQQLTASIARRRYAVPAKVKRRARQV
jgi:hypothetical protein